MSHRSPLSGLLFTGLFVLVLPGCGAAPDDAAPEEQVGSAAQNIAGGYKDLNDTNVVGIYDNSLGGLCSGSLIAPNLILTARHCVSAILNDVGGGVSCNQTTFGPLGAPGNFFVTTKPYFTQNASDYHLVREVLGVPVDDTHFCGNDQAMLVLDDNIAPGEATPLTPRVDAELVAGEEYHAIGYGNTSDGGNDGGDRRRRDGLFIDCVSESCPTAYVKATEWVGDQGICSGDSGGPALDGLNRVTGVVSRGPAGCEDPVYGSIYRWAQWIKDSTLYAAQLGGYPTPPWATGWPTDPAYSMPVGSACVTPAECPSNLCLDGYCTRSCNAASPCQAGYTCDEAFDLCVQDYVEPPPEPEPEPEEEAEEPADDGCSIGRRGNPTKPIPWFTGAAAAMALAALRRRRRAR